jgi:regulator of protease activity HflC (stomatin/prohibitin superfamily)
MKTSEEKFTGMKMRGFPMLALDLLLFCGTVFYFIWAVESAMPSWLQTFTTIVDVLLFMAAVIIWAGFFIVEPNEARVMLFFGKYHGTVKENGFFWVNPFYVKSKLTLRARNLDVAPIKVNDKRGNPVMIGQVVVWRIVDTYKASFDIDNMAKTSAAGTTGNHPVAEKMKAYEHFVKVQSDAALRFVAGMFSYDNAENEDEKLTLRSGGEEINDILEKQLNERLSIAGIEVMEARVNYLAYAPEIAAVMLRRQQADAIISAREKIVDGAVSMVKLAINKLSEQGVIELDDDKKAAMVSNLMVVLCSDEPAQPVVNSGTLYN